MTKTAKISDTVIKYSGSYNKQGLYHEQGTAYFYDGGKYIGEWKDGKKHGVGRCRYATGAVYVGEFKDNKRHGKGCIGYPSGAMIAGDFKTDVVKVDSSSGKQYLLKYSPESDPATV